MSTFNYFENYGPGERLKGNKTRIKFYQTGGAVNEAANAESDEDQMRQQIVALVQAAMQGDQKAQQQIQQIMQAAQSGDQQAQAIAQVVQQVVQQMQGQAREAKYGAKLNYIHKLRTGLNRDEKVYYQKCGGKVSKRVYKVKKGQGGLNTGSGLPYQPIDVIGRPGFIHSGFQIGDRSIRDVPDEYKAGYYWAGDWAGKMSVDRVDDIMKQIAADVNKINEYRGRGLDVDTNYDCDQLMRRVRFNLASLYVMNQRKDRFGYLVRDRLRNAINGIDAFVQGLNFVDVQEIAPTEDEIDEVAVDMQTPPVTTRPPYVPPVDEPQLPIDTLPGEIIQPVDTTLIQQPIDTGLVVEPAAPITDTVYIERPAYNGNLKKRKRATIRKGDTEVSRDVEKYYPTRMQPGGEFEPVYEAEYVVPVPPKDTAEINKMADSYVDALRAIFPGSQTLGKDVYKKIARKKLQQKYNK